MNRYSTERGKVTRVKIFEVIEEYIEEHKYSPSIRDICEILNIKSTSTVQRHLESLEKDGFIERNSSLPRTIKVLGGKW